MTTLLLGQMMNGTLPSAIRASWHAPGAGQGIGAELLIDLASKPIQATAAHSGLLAAVFANMFSKLTTPGLSNVAKVNFGISQALVAAIVCMIIISKATSIWQRHYRGKNFATFAASKGCLRTRRELPRRFMSSLRNKLNLLQYNSGDLLDDVFAKEYREYGETHALYDSSGIAKVIHTIDPVNVNTVLSAQSQDYRGPKNRKAIMYPLAQDGMLTAEGAQWVHHRKTIQRLGFRGAKDCRSVEPDVQLFFQAVGPAVNADGWTQEIDMLDLFFRMALDMSLHHFFGTTAGSQLAGIQQRAREAAMAEFNLVPAKHNGKDAMNYMEAYGTIRKFIGWRAKLGSKYWMADSPKYRQACAMLNDTADDIIRAAMKRAEETREARAGNLSLVDSLVRVYSSVAEIREVLMDVFMAGQNMTGTTAAWLFAELEHQPHIYQQIRAEVLERFGTEDEPRAPLTWDNLRNCSNLQHTINETLRKYPPLPSLTRNALCDTVLPRGGGPDGTQPIAVPKGTAVTCSVYLMHRREQEWGADVEEFKPERWRGRKFGPEYVPFGGGPRVCIGQQLAMSEISYVTARVMQRFDKIQAPEGSGNRNLVKGYEVLVQPKHGVKLRLHHAS